MIPEQVVVMLWISWVKTLLAAAEISNLNLVEHLLVLVAVKAIVRPVVVHFLDGLVIGCACTYQTVNEIQTS